MGTVQRGSPLCLSERGNRARRESAPHEAAGVHCTPPPWDEAQGICPESPRRTVPVCAPPATTAKPQNPNCNSHASMVGSLNVVYAPTAMRTWHHGYDACQADAFVWMPGKEGRLFRSKPGIRGVATSTQPPWGLPKAFLAQHPAQPHVNDNACAYEIRDQLIKLAKQQKRIAKLHAQLEQQLLTTKASPPRPSTGLRRDEREHLCSKYDAYTQLRQEHHVERAAAPPRTSRRPASAAAATSKVQFAGRAAPPETEAPRAAEDEQRSGAPPPAVDVSSPGHHQQHRPKTAGAAARRVVVPDSGYGRFPSGQLLVEPHAPASAPPPRRVRPVSAAPTRRADGTWAPADPDPRIAQHLSGMADTAMANSPRLTMFTRTAKQPHAMQRHARSADGRETAYSLDYCQPAGAHGPRSAALDVPYHPSRHNVISQMKPA